MIKQKTFEKIVFDKRTYTIHFTTAEKQQYKITFFPRAEFCTMMRQGVSGKIFIRLVTRGGKRYIRPKDVLYILSGNKTLKKRMVYRFERYHDGLDGGVYIHNLYYTDGHYTDDRPEWMKVSSFYPKTDDDRHRWLNPLPNSRAS